MDSTKDTLTDRKLMQKNSEKVKKSTERLTICGNYVEHRIYEKPFFWNFRALARSCGKPFTSEELTCVSKEEWDKLQHSPAGSNNEQKRREDSIQRSRQSIMEIVQANENAHEERMKFITYTFAEEVTDLQTARNAWSEYIRQLKQIYGAVKYIGVAEIQKKRYKNYGVKVWHFHVLFFNLPFRYGAKDFHARLWGKGFVKMICIDHVKNLGLYVSKYLRKDLQETQLLAEKSYFCSKGLKKPEKYRRESNVHKILNSIEVVVEYESQFESKNYGIIKISKGKLK